MSENRKAKPPIRPRARPQPEDQATQVAELDFHRAYPITLPGAWPSEEPVGQLDSDMGTSYQLGTDNDFANPESSNTTPTTSHAFTAADREESYPSGFESPLVPEDLDFAFPSSRMKMQEQHPIGAEEADFAFAGSSRRADVSSAEIHNSVAIPLADILFEDAILEKTEDLAVTADQASMSDNREPLPISDDEPIPVTESGATEFQEEVTRIAAMETNSVNLEHDSEPIPHSSRVTQLHEAEEKQEKTARPKAVFGKKNFNDSALNSNNEEVLVVIESRNTSTREVALTPDEFATAEQQILENRYVHIPGKVVVLDAVAIFRHIEQIGSRRRRRTA